MFKEILKIIPQLDNSALAKMENSLATRFKRVAKGFGKGLMSTLKGGAVLGAISFLANKLLSPLKETQEAIDRALQSADTLATNAKEFNTTAGKLARLQGLARSTGLDEGTLSEAITKFQVKLAEATADPTKDTSVRSFVGQKDIAEAFFGYIQGLQRLNPDDRKVAMTEVFGDARKQVKFFDFLQTDFGKQIKELGPITAAQIDKAVGKLAPISDLTDTLSARRDLEDIVNKSRVITPNFALQRDRQEREVLKQENNRIKSYESLIAMDITMKQVETKVQEIGLLLATQVPVVIEKLQGFGTVLGNMAFKLTEIFDKISKISVSSAFRRFFGGGGE